MVNEETGQEISNYDQFVIYMTSDYGELRTCKKNTIE